MVVVDEDNYYGSGDGENVDDGDDDGGNDGDNQKKYRLHVSSLLTELEGGVLRLYGALLAEGGVVWDNYGDGFDDDEEDGDCGCNDEDDAACVYTQVACLCCLLGGRRA